MRYIINFKNRILKSCGSRFIKCLLLPILFVSALILNSNAQGTGQGFISFDLSKSNGKIKPLNGINLGTDVRYTQWTDYLTQAYADLKIPYTRLHDCHYPYPDVVDIPAIFPLFHLDADDPSNYNFKKTDDYILELLKSGTKIAYRLGVSIEHSKVKYYIYPPADYDKWAKICVNIIRHYNEGWANGFHLNIKYWEVWNEPDVDECWGGSKEQYFELYKTTVKAIKKHNPDIMVGTAGVANVSRLGPPLLAYCKENQLPIDFFSWHSYTTDPQRITEVAIYARKLLDDYGYTKTESHLNEWNHWPGDWKKLGGRYYWKKMATTGMGGAASTAFTASTLINLQDLPVDQAMFYSGYRGIFSLFDFYCTPRKQFYAFKAMAMLLDAPERITCEKDSLYSGISAIGGLTGSKSQAIIMVSNFNSKQKLVNIRVANVPWENATRVEVFVIDEENNLNLSPHTRVIKEGTFTLEEELPAPMVKVLRLTSMAKVAPVN